MKIGAVFPTVEIGTDVGLIRDYVRTVDELGFGHLLMIDHVLGIDPGEGPMVGPYTYQHPFHEPLTFLAWAAGQTRDIELITGILILPQRQTVLVAKQATEIDILSGGRLRIGVGIGWNKPEYVGLGQDFHTRGKRVEAQILLMRELWTKPLLDVRDRWHTVEHAGINPRPPRPIPVWLGGMSEAAMQRAARIGDGWLPNFLPDEHSGELGTAMRGGRASEEERQQKKSRIADTVYHTGERAKDVLDRLREYLKAEGREAAPFTIHGGLSVVNRSLDDALRWTDKWQDLGVDYLALDTQYAGLRPEQHLQVLQRFAEARRLR